MLIIYGEGDPGWGDMGKGGKYGKERGVVHSK